jgi:acyl-CoA thioesterase
MWDMRTLSSRDPGRSEQGRVWMREIRQLVEGVSLTPFVRAASAADWSNPGANWGSNGLEFINADITLYLHRYPRGEWIGFETSSHHSADGIAVGQCTMYDEEGAIGSSTVCAIAQRRRVGG